MYIGTVEYTATYCTYIGSFSFFLRLITLLFVVYNIPYIHVSVCVCMYISISYTLHTPYIHIIIQSPDDRNRDV